MASIQKRGEVYRVRINRKGYSTLSKTFATRREALRWAQTTEYELDAGLIEPREEHSTFSAENPTFDKAAHHYAKTHSILKRNCRSETGILNILAKRWESRAVTMIKPADIALLRDDLLRRGRAPCTVNHYLNSISKVFQMLRNECGIDLSNPCSLVKRPRPNPPRNLRLTNEAKQELLFACAASPERFLLPIVSLALETAMRRGELMHLKWQDINLQHRTATLNKTKNGHVRQVPLSARAIGILERLPREGPEVFPIQPERMRHQFERIIRKLTRTTCLQPNPYVGFTFHCLRHEALSNFSDIGLNIAEIASISGHRRLSSLTRYVHPRQEIVLRKLDSFTM